MAAPTADARPPAPDPSYATPAWLGHGTHATPGVLALHDGRLSFTADDTVVFDEPVARRPGVAFPRYAIGGAITVRAGGSRHHLCLTRPHGAADVDAAPCGCAADGRRAGRIWRTLLAE